MRMRTLAVVSVTSVTCALCCLACGDVPLGDDPSGNGRPGTGDVDNLGLPGASDFTCDSLDGAEEACLDWNDATSTGLDVEGGRWEVREGMVVGFGPDTIAGDCTDSLMTHALARDVEAQDLAVRVRLASIERVDKVLVLRSADPANRIQVNFRATDVDGGYGDLMVQEIRDCVFTMFTTENEVPIPHAFGDAVEAEVELVGNRLVVTFDDRVAFDRELPIALRPGRVGFGIIDRSVSVFDDLIVTSFDPLQ